ncbi:glycyl-tRNA synthetase-like protein [Ascodesmis nigricans]|uniref:glycine--tRNA ligase n=1 Tax=Ascodesmis nigricans TaxID=341454 RepID=A0A4S2N4Y5_9PEZI|nr:glycyl-tRNA synthetase-like protein [Ascodesmis nigricans]
MATTKVGQPLDRGTLDSILRRRMFYTPAFELYGGVSGLYDYGPPGCALQANIVDLWRKHFVMEEDMMEVDTTMLTPYEVLKTSGHVDKFADWMCKDPKTGEHLRADHLVEDVLEARLKGDAEARGEVVDEPENEADSCDKKKARKKKVKDVKAVKLEDDVKTEYKGILAQIDNYNGEELGELIQKHSITNNGNPVEPPISFNLMFGTAIGPSSNMPGFLRPETAQGQFLTFAKLLDFNNARMPFASASIGKSFRNEISPKSGLLRVREFLMAEIEHFVDPENKNHPRFKEVADTVKLRFLPKDVQLAKRTDLTEQTIGEAVKAKMVDNETLGYFMARIYLFLTELGVDPKKIRFRQHMANEMAHYATDCWDAELETSYGWIECVGCADRSAYDLSVHSKRTGQPLLVRENLEIPKVWEEWDMDVDKKWLGPRFKKDAKKVETVIESISQEEREKLAAKQKAGEPVIINVPDLGEVTLEKVEIVKREKKLYTREFIPNVIEPSFGIGRIFYSLIEHVYHYRPEDRARGVLSFPPKIAPTKVLIVPLSGNKDFDPAVHSLSRAFRKIGVANRVDDSSATIGKRYARNDELGTPFGVTVDFQTVKDGTVTLRDRDTMQQVRASQEEIVNVVTAILEGRETWEDVVKRLGLFEGQDLEN